MYWCHGITSYKVWAERHMCALCLLIMMNRKTTTMMMMMMMMMMVMMIISFTILGEGKRGIGQAAVMSQ